MAEIKRITIPAVTEKRTRMVEVTEDVVIEDMKERIQITLTPHEAAALAAILENRSSADNPDDTFDTEFLYSSLRNFAWATIGSYYYKDQKIREREWRKARIVYESGKLENASWVDSYFK